MFLLIYRKLNIYGISGIYGRGFQRKSSICFLSSRKFSSSENKLCCVVLQGSTVGSKLYVLYVNDMVNESKILKFVMFADDINLFGTIKDIVTFLYH